MVTKDNKVKIMDFGIAETVRTSMSRIQNSSSSGTLVYMSPEQIKGKGLGKESDIYSFGVLLYELLNGNPPFYKGALEYQILNEKPEQLSAVSAKMNDLIMKCLEKDYENRFNDFKEVLKFLGKKDVKHILNIQKDIPAKNNQFIRFMNPFSWLIMSVIIISIFASLSKASQWNIFGMSAYEMEQGRHPFESGIFIGSLISISICFYFIYNKWHKIKNSEMFAYLFGIIILLLIIDEDMVLGFIAWVILSTIVIIIQFREKRIKSLFKAWWMQNLILLLFYSILMLVWEVETILLFLVIFISIIYINGNVYWIVSRGKGKRKIPIIVSIGIIIIIIVCIFAYITIAEKNAWKTAKKSDTEESYKEYLSKYPSTKNSENATEIVAKKWLNRTFSKNVIDSIDTDIFSFKQAGYYFSDTFSTNENDWDEFDTDEKYFQIINGKANMKQLGEGHSFWNWKYISSLNPKNFIIKFEIDLPSTGYGVGIFFSGKETRYRNFIMISLSFFGCGYYDEDKSGEKWVTGDKLLNPVEPDNHILVEARIMGDSIRLYMNSEYIGDVKGIINSGINRIGFVLGGAGPRVQFDNLFVYKLTKRK
jgi:serine/threonine protein kinase